MKPIQIQALLYILMIGDPTYYLNKSETITIAHCLQCYAHMDLFHYCDGQQTVFQVAEALVDHGTNGGIVGDDMLIL